VTARALANAYAQTLGQVFTHEMKPYEVEILVAQVGDREGEPNELYHIFYDGTMMDEHGFTVLGGQAEALTEVVRNAFLQGLDLGAAIRLCTTALGAPDNRSLTAEQLEVAVLDQNQPRRHFRRIKNGELTALLTGAPAGKS
jgi:proteasome alpha subunit